MFTKFTVHMLQVHLCEVTINGKCALLLSSPTFTDFSIEMRIFFTDFPPKTDFNNFVRVFQKTYVVFIHLPFYTYKAGYTLIAKYEKMGAKCKKQKVYSGVFCATFFALRTPFFAFRILRRSWHSCEKSKDSVAYFFAASLKHEICVKCEKCLMSVSYFVVCFAKNTREMRKVYSRPKNKQAELFFDNSIKVAVGKTPKPGSANMAAYQIKI